jgi:FkbM family methyltransferase
VLVLTTRVESIFKEATDIMVPDLIYDIGMYDGSDTEYYLKKGFRVIAVDANTRLCELVKHRLAEYLKTGQLTILNVGISSTLADVTFFVATNKLDWSSFDRSFAERFDGSVEEVKIPCVTLSELMQEYGVPYYAKIDIEGRDRDAVVSLLQLSDFPRFVSVEATVADFSMLMANVGYGGFKLINQVYTCTVPSVFPPLEGQFAETCFSPGRHSGPFGEETYGRWLTRAEFEAEHKAIREMRYDDTLQKQFGLPEAMLGRWYDFHARFG